MPTQVVITKTVQEEELLTLKKLEGDEPEGSQLETAIDKGLLIVVDFESDVEEDTFINYVAVMGDDGESVTGAIAFHRNWAIATDEKRAISFFKKEAPKLNILSTLEIVKHWAETENLSSRKLLAVLKAIRVKGRYKPHKAHPLLGWWEKAMEEPINN